MSRVVVVGSGAAGTAAALAAARAGATVTLVHRSVGATSMTSGALDGAAGGEETARALGIYTPEPSVLVTVRGVRRASMGRDQGLAHLGADSILVARVPHVGWDADALADALREEDERVLVRDVGLLLHTDERVMQHVELAARHDDPARLAFAAERLRVALAMGGSFGLVLLPPWLGVTEPRAAALGGLVGGRCGEALSGVDGPCGARFEHARDRALAHAGVSVRSGWVARASSDGVWLLDGEHLPANAVVLATGGLLGGGLAFTPGAPHAYSLTFDAPAKVGVGGRPLLVTSSVWGIAPESGTSEHVGIVETAPRVFVAGEALADRARTMLDAFATGEAAGAQAASA